MAVVAAIVVALARGILGKEKTRGHEKRQKNSKRKDILRLECKDVCLLLLACAPVLRSCLGFAIAVAVFVAFLLPLCLFVFVVIVVVVVVVVVVVGVVVVVVAFVVVDDEDFVSLLCFSLCIDFFHSKTLSITSKIYKEMAEMCLY